jgi:hypothetical protein
MILSHPIPIPNPLISNPFYPILSHHHHIKKPTTEARPTGIQEKNYIYKKRNYRQDVRVGACITQKEKKN